ncbi:MAG: flagellin [Chitinivibrionales bacterium]|nr:flagellin [Chitinivibrionales bacterium]MBD3358415.1 flagellin [Chitinivibrionales bacterium]
MRINHNIASMVTQGSLFRVNRDMSKSLEQLSTGLRINSAADDAAGLGVSENLRTQVRGTAQAKRNAMDGIAAISVAEGAANEISDILQRMRELAVQSSNDTLTATERAYTNQEFRALIDEIDRIADVTNYNRQKLLSSGGSRFGQGSGGSALWVDANAVYGVDSITVTIDTLTTATGNGIGVQDLQLMSQSSSATAISTLDSAIDSVNTMRSNMGAYVNRIEHAINNLTISNTNQQSAESLIRDVDFAHASARFTRNQILSQSATAMLSQANMVPQGVLQLLG